MTPMRYVVLVLGVVVRIASFSNETAERSMYLQISLHYILSFSHEAYSRATSLSRLTESLRKPSVPPYHIPTPDEYYRNSTITPPDRKANAAFVVLARNNDLDGVLSSMKQMEDRFNKKFNYPWIFLNEQPFTEEFKKWAWSIKVNYKLIYPDGQLRSPVLQPNTASSQQSTGYNLIGLMRTEPPWLAKRWLVRTLYTEVWVVILAPSMTHKWLINRKCAVRLCFLLFWLLTNAVRPPRYRNMCRFNSGVSIYSSWFMFPHLILRTVLLSPWTPKRLWLLLACRVCALPSRMIQIFWNLFERPSVKFFCDLDYDPFLIMKDQNKVYGNSLS